MFNRPSDDVGFDIIELIFIQALRVQLERRDEHDEQGRPTIQYWERYNSGSEDSEVVYNDRYGHELSGISYSHIFFTNLHLSAFLNMECKRMLQFGAATGKFLQEYQGKGWSVMGYDYSPTSIKSLRAKQLPCRQIDLNDVSGSGTLSYSDELEEELAKGPTNIMLIRVLGYLEKDAVRALLAKLIHDAKKGSVFFYGDLEEEDALESSPRKSGYVASFFSHSSNVEILKYETANHHDRVLVARKYDDNASASKKLKTTANSKTRLTFH